MSILIVTTYPNPADRLDCHYTRIEFTSPDLRGDRYTATAGVWFPGHNDNVGGVEVPQPSPRFAMLGCWYDDEAAALAAWRCNVNARSTHHTLVDALAAPAAPTTCATDRAWEGL